jgi:hypothetical protein
MSATQLQLGNKEAAAEHGRLAVEGAPCGFHKVRRPWAAGPAAAAASARPPRRSALSTSPPLRPRLLCPPLTSPSPRPLPPPAQAYVRYIDALYACGRLREAEAALDAAVASDATFKVLPEFKIIVRALGDASKKVQA